MLSRTWESSTSDGIAVTSARLSIIANQLCLLWNWVRLPFERVVGEIFPIANIVPRLIR